MSHQNNLNYARIAEAITYLNDNFQKQPTLNDVAEHVHLSPFHFQRLFTEWAGTSPKKFLQYISVQHAKNLLKEKHTTLLETTFETGLSSTSRLHDLFVSIDGMTPAEYKNGGHDLAINYSFTNTVFGNILAASTEKGICHMAFYEEEKAAFQTLILSFPNARFTQRIDQLQQNALLIFQHDATQWNAVKLHLKGTDFQLKVWEALLKIPMGDLSTYGAIAEQVANPNASRAVGTAIGSNPVAYLIPCHRVIQSTGKFGQYMWGTSRKTAMIGWEAAQVGRLVDDREAL